MAFQNMLFFDTNYVEFNNAITGGSLAAYLNTSTVQNGYDNRSDGAYVTFNTTTGEYMVDLGTTVTVSEFLLLNHNAVNGALYYSGSTTAWTQIGSNFSATSNYYVSSTVTGRYFKVLILTTTGEAPARFGQFVVTNKKFQLNNNPNFYRSNIAEVWGSNRLFTGRYVHNQVSDQFSAEIGWDYLVGDLNSMTGTDMQNMTELARQKASFLFYPNGGSSANSYPEIYTWQASDLYKCKITNDSIYEMSNNARLDVMRVNYIIDEVQ